MRPFRFDIKPSSNPLWKGKFIVKKVKIKNEEVTQLLDAEVVSFPKYATQLINLANQNAQGTRPEVVGQMSDLIQEFKGRKLREWEE